MAKLKIVKFGDETKQKCAKQNGQRCPGDFNPKIIAFSGEQQDREGCLSNPGFAGITKRPRTVTVRAMNRNGEVYDLTGSDLLARAICHECDHLDGKLYTDVQIRPIKD